MNLGNPVEEFANLRVHDYNPAEGISHGVECAYRIAPVQIFSLHLDLFQVFEAFLKDAAAGEVAGLLFAGWSTLGEEGEDVPRLVEALLASRKKLTGLRALFLGEDTDAEGASYAAPFSSLAGLPEAFPELRHLRLRGCRGLSLGAHFRHEALRSLALETCALSEEVLGELAAAALPLLEHLELWLGSDQLDAADPATLRPLLNARRFPHLRYLGLRNSRQADEVAYHLSELALPRGLKVLDLSLGNLTQEGSLSLSQGDWMVHLETLDLRHHYLTDAAMWRLSRLKPFVDLRWGQDPTTSYANCHNAVGEFVEAGTWGPPERTGDEPREPEMTEDEADDWNCRRRHHLDGFRRWRNARWQNDLEDA